MPRRPFGGIRSFATSPQPSFGSVLTAAATPVYDQFAGNVTGANPSQTTLAVTSTVGFRNGDPILVCTSYPVIGTPNVGWIVNILSSTSMTVKGLTAAVASGAFVVLNTECETVLIQAGASITGPIYVGAASTVSSTDSSVFAILTSGGMLNEETSGISHPWKTCEYWLADSTSGDSFIASYSQG
jgi:hypothetical protein